MTVLGNFDVLSGNIVPNFQNTGKWYNYMTGDSITVASVTASINLLPGEYRIYTSKKLPQPPAGYIRFSTTATKEFAEEVNEFMVFPNPTISERIFIGYNLKNGGTVQWSVFNAVGQQVAVSSLKTVAQGSYQDTLNMKLPQGAYFIKLSVNGATAVRKIISE